MVAERSQGVAGAPLAGVAMCVYNGERYLNAQLDSMARQTSALDHVVIVDDNSSDGSWELLQRWRDSCGLHVTLVRNTENLGIVRNFGKAASLVESDIVFFADQDDVWYPEKVARVLAAFSEQPDLMLVHSDADLIDQDGQAVGRRLFDALLVRADERAAVREGRAPMVYLKRNLVTGAACAVRASLIKRALPFPPDWLHDEWLALAAGLCGRVAMLDDTCMAYRLHTGNAVGLPLPNLRWRWHSFTRAVLEPQRPALLRRQQRLQTLQRRLADWRAPNWFHEQVGAALAHISCRLSLPPSASRRLRPVWSEWHSRRYHAWSQGELSMLHDLILAS